MITRPGFEEKLYAVTPERKLSVRDLLEYFSKHGSMRVSDLHLKVGVPPVYRLDGALQKMKSPPLDAPTLEAMVRGFLGAEEWAAFEKHRSVDASFVTETMQFRINCFRDNEGIALAIRALDPTPLPVESIGFPNGVWQDIVKKQYGLVLMTGVTGAGKSTTIASLISRIAETRPCRIITLEDPIEYRLASKASIISQREVGRDVPSFERGLRDCLREDPDVIFVGEMRDQESARWTMTAAETGHLVFSTIHTRDTRGTLTRILDMFPTSQQDEIASQLSLGLAYVISQKLVPRADNQGRVVAMEILHNTYAVSNLIRVQKVEQIYSQLQSQTRDVPEQRMCTLERTLAQLARAGKISPLEAEKHANHPTTFLDEMQRLEG
ncbi:MAG: PilT/PilU family type 4a pilus ATPase [Phycisphaerales bacterium]|nr:PilT/PilU family type 4a pilus ATPase [Phycisphaerales bacterium]